MASDSEEKPPVDGAEDLPVIAVEDEEMRRRLRLVLGNSALQIDVVDPNLDPLAPSGKGVADLMILRRSSVGPEELARLRRRSQEVDAPDLFVVTEGAGDFERTELLSAGVAGVLESQGQADELRQAVQAVSEVRHGSPRNLRAVHDDSIPRLSDFHSRSPGMRSFLSLVDRVAETDSSLLLTGETGVGKERLAQAVHNEGERSSGPFISVNCGAIPESLLESELFGHEAGAFTGAEGERKGRFEMAEGGTIFLDEIGEMPMHLQVRLLSVLQRRRLRRVGGEDMIPVDVRVMAATNRDLEEEIRQRRFREDLYFRLNVVNLEIPPLRKRAKDIPDLVGSFLRHLRHSLGRNQVEGISREALEQLSAYAWPGNVRELVNAVEHAVVMCRGKMICLEDLPERVQRLDSGMVQPQSQDVDAEQAPDSIAGIDNPDSHQSAQEAPPIHRPLREAKAQVGKDFERRYLKALLEQNSGRVGRVAELAGITTRSLYDKLKAHGLRKEDFRT